MKADYVIEGGGVKIPGLVGALVALEAKGFEPYRLAGTSAGAIVSAMAAAGYKADKMREIIFNLDLSSLKDRGWFKTIKLFTRLGLHTGDSLEQTMRELLHAKNVQCFGDLKLANDKATHRYKLRVLLSDITNERLVVLPDDAEMYGLDPDKVDVAWAVRASASIPGFFRPVVLDGETYFVDGGLLSNFPIWMFDAEGAPEWPTFGLMLTEERSVNPIDKWPHQYVLALFNTVLTAHDKMFLKPEEYAHRTIRIPVSGVKATDFKIKFDKKKSLYLAGYTAASKFLVDWSWPSYRSWAIRCRQGVYSEEEINAVNKETIKVT